MQAHVMRGASEAYSKPAAQLRIPLEPFADPSAHRPMGPPLAQDPNAAPFTTMDIPAGGGSASPPSRIRSESIDVKDEFGEFGFLYKVHHLLGGDTSSRQWQCFVIFAMYCTHASLFVACDSYSKARSDLVLPGARASSHSCGRAASRRCAPRRSTWR